MRSHSTIFTPRTLAAASILLLSASAALSANVARRGSTRSAAHRAPRAAASAAHTGAQVFRARCASCHGAKGEGTKRYSKALTGSKSVGQLAAFIAKSMPPAPARKCASPDAQKVAQYIYDAFYSPLAQARNRPARIELSRLTARQYRNAVTDLVGSFRSAAPQSSDHGLHAEYFNAAELSRERVLERVDPEIHFNFGTNGALPGQKDPYLFSMRWNGSVLAPDSGEYEFVVHTEHAVRLWVNDMRRPLIDAWVKSGSDTEFRASITLLGGRSYPLRLEFSKGIQGVDNPEKLKQKPPAPASLSLEWKRPKRADEVIPQRCLSPVVTPEVFVLTAPFPPDDRSLGYERGNSVSKEWDEAATEAAIETAGYVLGHLRELSGVPDDAPDRDARLRQFCRKFVERAFRRPLSDEQAQFFVEKQFKSGPDAETRVKRVVLLALESPRFLYREMGSGKPDAYDVASRLSFGLWDSLPDPELLRAAGAGELATREQVARQAERMVADPRAWSKLREFFFQWLKVDQYPDLAKDAKKYPGFDAAVASDLRTSLELFLEDVFRDPRSDFRDLMLSDKVFLNGRLAKFYGVQLPADAPFQPVKLDEGRRAGVLTQPYLLASFAYLNSSSPIHRGVLVMRNMLGRVLAPPPQAFAPFPAELHPDLTTRQRVALQTKPAFCNSCHGKINPLGFTLENFDAIGRFRTEENGHPVDASGMYQPAVGKPVKFDGAHDLASYLAGSEEARTAFAGKLFQYTVKQPVRAYGPHALADLARAFSANDFSIRKQLVETMAASALATSSAPAGPRPTPTRSHPRKPSRKPARTARR